jgi:serine/threonine protein kinase
LNSGIVGGSRKRSLTQVTTVVAGGADRRSGSQSHEEEAACAAHLPERYQYLGLIGRGGMGSVHRVRDLELLRVVAMKLLAPELAERPQQIERFLREAQLTAQLDHPNIVPVHELSEDQAGNRYFTMKRVEGRTLREWIETTGRPVEAPEVLNEMLATLLKVCDALAFAHSRGVLHCDMKPDNIMVGPFGQVYLMDWGLASLKQEREGAAALPAELPTNDQAMRTRGSEGLSGTPAYMSPEQAFGYDHLCDERTDVFGIGAVLYSILTGAAPFEGDDVDQVVAKARACVVGFPATDRGAPLPVGLCQVVKRAMARDHAQRYPSVVQLKAELTAAMHMMPFADQLFPPGSRIVVEGEPGECAYILVRGTCQAYKTVGPRRHLLRRLGPGTVFGEAAIFSGGVRTATVEAEDEVLVRVVTRQTLEQQLGLGTPYGAFVVALADRFRELEQRYTGAKAPPARRRTARKNG